MLVLNRLDLGAGLLTLMSHQPSRWRPNLNFSPSQDCSPHSWGEAEGLHMWWTAARWSKLLPSSSWDFLPTFTASSLKYVGHSDQSLNDCKPPLEYQIPVLSCFARVSLVFRRELTKASSAVDWLEEWQVARRRVEKDSSVVAQQVCMSAQDPYPLDLLTARARNLPSGKSKQTAVKPSTNHNPERFPPANCAAQLIRCWPTDEATLWLLAPRSLDWDWSGWGEQSSGQRPSS